MDKVGTTWHRLEDAIESSVGGSKVCKWVLTGALVGSGVYVIIGAIRKHLWQRRLRQAVEGVRKSREEQFVTLERRLEDSSGEGWEERRGAILDMTMKELLASLQSNETTPSEALKAYQWKALQAQARCNCICFFVEEAYAQVEELERRFGNYGDVKPILYGLPISVKESIYVQHQISTRGFAQSLLSPSVRASDDAVIVAQLRALGAVPFCTTNVPQTLMSFTSSNPVYGTSTHPLNPQRNPGGSSGGEAALIAFGGSLAGLGTDVAGSIRMPAHVSGIAGLKPTSGRVSQIGMNSSLPGRPFACASVGPMAADVESLEVIMRSLLNSSGMFQVDPYVSPIPFRSEIYESREPLKIGYYVSDDLFPTIPACRRAVLEAKDVLERCGHSLVEIPSPNLSEAMKFVIPIQFNDSGRYLGQQMHRDIVDPYHMAYYRMYRMPDWIKRVIGRLTRPIWPRVSSNYSHFADSTDDLRRIYDQANLFRTELTQSWLTEGLDGVVCPVNAGVAHPHAVHSTTSMAAGYTAIYNILDYPGGVLPVTRVSRTDDVALAEKYETRDPLGRLLRDGNLDSEGLPVGVQVVSYPFHEEVVLRIMHDIEREVRIQAKQSYKKTSDGKQPYY